MISSPCRQPGSRSRRWRFAIPACESVNEANTPIAYRGISRWTSAWKSTPSAVDATASPMTPLEKTSRCPRLVSGLGMKSSVAWKLASLGKSANDVLAARIRMSVVAT